MELKDIKTLEDVNNQLSIYGVIIEQLADNLQDLKSIPLDITPEKLDVAQALLYRASRLLAKEY